ncbi:TIGR02206 family membrane protein [Bacillus haikouensis]|nr:TIGR02206 family membrane protein [Bacillus haikouensis]
MKDLFNFRYKEFPFQIYSASHIIAVLLMIIFIVLLYKYRNNLSMNGKKAIRLILIATLAAGEIFFQFWYALNGLWSPAVNLPFQLCSLSIYLCIIMLITRNKLIFEVAFFASLTGAFIAMITPELFFGYPHIRFFQFFIVHAAIILSCFYMRWVEGFSSTVLSPIKSFLGLNLFAAAAYVLNMAFGGNYMFLAHKPYNPSPIDYLGDYPWYLLSLEAISLILFYLMYLPIHLNKNVKK